MKWFCGIFAIGVVSMLLVEGCSPKASDAIVRLLGGGIEESRSGERHQSRRFPAVFGGHAVHKAAVGPDIAHGTGHDIAQNLCRDSSHRFSRDLRHPDAQRQGERRHEQAKPQATDVHPVILLASVTELRSSCARQTARGADSRRSWDPPRPADSGRVRPCPSRPRCRGRPVHRSC